MPVDFDCTRDVGHRIEQGIATGFDHSDRRVVQVLLNPLGTDQNAGIGLILGGHLSADSSVGIKKRIDRSLFLVLDDYIRSRLADGKFLGHCGSK